MLIFSYHIFVKKLHTFRLQDHGPKIKKMAMPMPLVKWIQIINFRSHWLHMGSHYWSTAVTALNICVKDVPISCTNNRPAVCNYSSTMLQLKASMSYAYSPKLSDVSAIYDTTATETPTATSTTNVFLYVKLYTHSATWPAHSTLPPR